MKQPLFSTSYAPRDGESTLDEIENDVFKVYEKFEEGINAQIENYKNRINHIDINEFTDETRQALSEFQNSIGLGEETVDETGKRVGDEIISEIYIKVASDLLRQKQLSKAKFFFEEAEKFNKSNPSIHQGLATLWLESQEYIKALVELSKAKRLFIQEKRLEDARTIDLYINRIPVSSRIIFMSSTFLRMCIVIIQEVI